MPLVPDVLSQDPVPAGPALHDRPLACLLEAEHPAAADARPVRCVRPEGLAAFSSGLSAAERGWLAAQDFRAKPGELVRMPAADGVGSAILGLGGTSADAAASLSPWIFGSLAHGLRGGAADTWRLELPPDDDTLANRNAAVLGFCLGAYRFALFRASGADAATARLVRPSTDGEGEILARAACLARDLINMPANVLGPRELAEAARGAMAGAGAPAEILFGDDLADRYPAVAAVGAGSDRPPQVLVARWRGSEAADDAPLLSLVGKGVCFDSGGYDIKLSAGMLRMKKDMGGAALMLALARAVIAHDLPIRLSLRLGCVENSVSGKAMRPLDVLRTRHGLTVEVGNTDAEGRLVLCDLLAEACEEQPSLLVDAATLTGAARVALGPDLPALFCNDDAVAGLLLEAGARTHDPLWRLPLWHGYDEWLNSQVADLNNVSPRPMAGALTAALFLQRFVNESVRWVHLDTYAWNDSARPGRAEGGEAPALRALFHGILPILNLERQPKQSGNVIGTEPRHFRGL